MPNKWKGEQKSKAVSTYNNCDSFPVAMTYLNNSQ